MERNVLFTLTKLPRFSCARACLSYDLLAQRSAMRVPLVGDKPDKVIAPRMARKDQADRAAKYRGAPGAKDRATARQSR